MAPLGILPTELWLLVALHIDDQADWSRLSQISRANYEQWTPYLYRNINIFTMKSLLSLAAFAKMHRSLDRWRRLRLHSLLFRHKRPSPFRSVQNLRVLISREATMTRQFRVNLRDAVKTLLLTWLVNFGLDVSLSRSGILHLLPPTCRLVYEQFHYPSWTLPRRLRATHLSLSCKPTRDSNITRLPAAPEAVISPGITHIVVGCAVDWFPVDDNFQEYIKLLLQLPKLQRLILILPVFPSDNNDGESTETITHALMPWLASISNGPSVVRIRGEEYSPQQVYESQSDTRRWNDLVNTEGDGFWERGERILVL